MRKWEYKIESRIFAQSEKEGRYKAEVDWLDELDAEGWELVAVVPIVWDRYRYYFRRAVV
jgi:hypothetical protein